MLQKAIEKVKSEMDQNKNNPYIQAVGDFLLQYLNTNPRDAEKVINSEKAIEKSLGEMRKAAEKKKVGNYAVLTGQEGFDIVLKYFGIEGYGTSYISTPASGAVLKPEVPECKPKVDFDIKLEDLL